MAEEMKKVILVVEDDEIINLAYKKALEAAGINSVFATTGDQACNLVKVHKPDLILLDIMLQGPKNGFDVLKILRDEEDTKAVPIFVMTNLDNTHEKEAMEMGATKFFVKANTSLVDIVNEIKNII